MSIHIHLLINQWQLPDALPIWMGKATGGELSVDIPSQLRAPTRSKV
jgi:hypothetical protein